MTSAPAAEALAIEPASSLPLLVWLSPSFPVGSFAYSHGLERVVADGDVKDLASATGWIGDLLAGGGPRNDAIILAAAYRGAAAADWAGLARVNELALALAGTRERLLETSAQGNAFLAAIRAAWRAPGIDQAATATGSDTAYPVAVGLVAAAHAIAVPATLTAFVTSLVANLVSAIIRLGAMGQTDGQRAIAALLPAITALACRAEGSTLADLGGFAPRSDLAAMRHETQYTRLFRS